MITFKSRNQILKNADSITRKAHSQYPHVSSSRIEYKLAADKVKDFFWGDMLFKMELKTAGERLKIEDDEKNLYRIIAESLKNSARGNCYEEAKTAELVGLINKVNNIYSGKIFINRKTMLNHEVAFITNKKLADKKLYSFKNKDAVILDPWLGITEFAQTYFARLTTEFKHIFSALDKKKKFNFYIQPDLEYRITPYKLKKMKAEYPELLIEGLKKIKL